LVAALSTFVARRGTGYCKHQRQRTPTVPSTFQPYVTEMLKQHLAGRETGLVFLSKRKTPLRNCLVLNKHLHPLLRKINIPRGGMHAFRHFRVSFLIQNETPLEIIKRWIGHGSEQMIHVYTHLHPTYRKEVIAKFTRCLPRLPRNEMQVIM